MAFKEAVYLVLDRRGVGRMTKRLPSVNRNEIVVKLLVTAADSAFREPTMVKEITISDPFDGLPMDVELSQPFITEAEAEQLKTQRRQLLIEQLEQQGYKVQPPDPGSDLDRQEEDAADDVYRRLPVSNTRKIRVLNPGTGLPQRASWGGGKAKVQLRRYFLAQQESARRRAREARRGAAS